MYFNSYEFILCFLPIVLLLYYFVSYLKQYKAANIILLLASLYFYYRFDWHFIPIILCSILMNYVLARIMRNNKRRRFILLIGIVLNILLLAYFKYSNFMINNLNLFFDANLSLMQLLVPLGISFFTFQQISFLVDSYRNTELTYPFLEYAIHILLFFYIISGPIVRHKQMIPQLLDNEKKRFDAEYFTKGMVAFTLGLAKKVLIADTFALAANWGFDNIASLNTTSAFLVMLAYTLQIFFDFSGYSDMVTGIGAMFHMDIPMNFNSPYKALTIIDFWKRWHMTLTKFFTDYIYIPLGGSRKGKVLTYINVMIVFVVSGLWHGANWTFIVWGCMHGFASVLNRLFKKQAERLNPILSWMLTFLFVNLAWVFFRSGSLQEAFLFIKTLLSCQFGGLPTDFVQLFMLPEFTFITKSLHLASTAIPSLVTILFFSLSIAWILQGKNTNEKLIDFHPTVAKACGYAILLSWSILSFTSVTSFIYVNF